jgi:kumamolisin
MKAQLVADTADAAGKPKPNAPAKPKALQKPLPADTIMKAYGADPDTFTGKGNHAFISFGGTVDDEAATYAKGKGYAGKFNTIQLGSEAPTADPTGANVENDLDFVTQALNLRKGNIDMLSNDNSTQGFVKGVDYVNHPSTNVEYDGASTSWGGPDKQAWNAQGRAALDESLKDGIALGKTLSFSAGDDGVTDRGSLPAQTDYPASSGNGIAVGGTELKLDAKGARDTEVVWSQSGATGGGVSAVESRPAYQKFITWVKSLSGKDGRIVPDISMDASPRTPVEVPTSQGLAGVGGTSFSNPLFYAFTRQLSEASGKDIGFINTQLYNWGQDPAIAKKVFFDVTSGDNGMGKTGYHAGPGFDAATGWGAPNFDAMVAELKTPSNAHLSAARSFGYGLGTSALRGAHTAITNPKALIPSFSTFKGWNTQNETKPGA